MRPLELSRTDSSDRRRIALHVTGAVQGVGFRPFIFRLATACGLAGSVRNTGAGVSLEAEGGRDAIERFLVDLRMKVRSPAAIDTWEYEERVPTGEAAFRIAPSSEEGDLTALVLPDMAPCSECLAELGDPADRRYRYPFTTCMHCGPRYTIIEAVPYDRERTAMQRFAMCPACRAEYSDTASRRFHAETNACPDCGPQLMLFDPGREMLAAGDAALRQAADAIRRGGIVALKGLGGFQLLCDARNDASVAHLRERKHRPAKPFAVMAGDPGAVREFAHITAQEEELLRSAAAPIVLARARIDGPVRLAESVAPDNPLVGAMLPSTPLHHLLITDLGFPVVATSGNLGGEPLAASDDEAFDRLSCIADLFLSHDRPILHPADDSVVRVIAGQQTVIRCARGFAPLVLKDDRQTEAVLALGGHMKNSVAAAAGGRIVLGPHIGDLANSETRSAFARAAKTLPRLHGVVPEIAACDMHSGYHSSQAAGMLGLPLRQAQHHLAHVLAGMVENGIEGPVLGVAWDGTGDGSDGTVWGGEFLVVSNGSWRRFAHFLPFRLPGGETAVREPRRAAIGALHAAFGDELWSMRGLAPVDAFSPKDLELLGKMLTRGLNAPLTSSAGRLFDAVAALLGLCQQASFDGQAAIAVESAATRASIAMALPKPEAVETGGLRQLDWRPMMQAMAEAVRSGADADNLASGFHDWLAEAIAMIARRAGISQAVLTGGCFQNARLTELAVDALEQAGCRPFRHGRVPCNDGGLAVGQAAYAARLPKREDA